MSDYISREETVKQITKVAEQIKTNNAPYIFTALYVNNKEDFPSADVRENIHGEWIFDEILDKHYYCSECKSMGVDYWDYCPYCGADMRGDNNG